MAFVDERYDHSEITAAVIGAAFEVYNELGSGFLESVYQRSMEVALREKSVQAICEYPIDVFFRGNCVGKFRADILVENAVLVELKVAPSYRKKDEAQVLNQLKATQLRVALLINFGADKVEHHRFVL